MFKKHSDFALEAGSDEAGRGCLAGPVVAAAVILPSFEKFSDSDNDFNSFLKLINDSKKISLKNRDFLRPIIEKIAVSSAITLIYPEVIDSINILNASILGMQVSVLKLNPLPNHIIIDGNAPFISKKGFYKEFSESEKKTLNDIPSLSIIKGDAKFMNIAAASVLAKTYRDEYMIKIDCEFPMYNWKKNKGYPTKDHRDAIQKYGLTKYHRLSFKSTLSNISDEK